MYWFCLNTSQSDNKAISELEVLTVLMIFFLNIEDA